MHRFRCPGLGLLFLGLVALPAAAQRSPDLSGTVLEEPRPNPILPAALVPFAIGSDVCRRGHTPLVSVRVHNIFTVPVAPFHLRDHPAVALDSVPLRCGQYVAQWDGTINGGTRAAPPGIYYVLLTVDGRNAGTKRMVVTSP